VTALFRRRLRQAVLKKFRSIRKKYSVYPHETHAFFTAF
jgi:hypothetical protein